MARPPLRILNEDCSIGTLVRRIARTIRAASTAAGLFPDLNNNIKQGGLIHFGNGKKLIALNASGHHDVVDAFEGSHLRLMDSVGVDGEKELEIDAVLLPDESFPGTHSAVKWGTIYKDRTDLIIGIMIGICYTMILPGMLFVAAVLLRPSPALRIGSGVSAAGSAVSLIPLRTVEGVDQTSWIILYVAWAALFSVYLWMQLIAIPSEASHRRKFFLFCAILLTIHFCTGISAQSSIMDGFTIFGPFIATMSVYLMSLLFSGRVQEEGQGAGDASVGQTQALSMTLGLCGL